jgi:hypothetical protein
MTEPRCCVCERPLAPGEWVYATHTEGKWVHGGCIDRDSVHYWRGKGPSMWEAGGARSSPAPTRAQPVGRPPRPNQ